MGRLEFEPDVDNSMVAVVGTAALHALSLCAVLLPASQSVSPNTLIANSATS